MAQTVIGCVMLSSAAREFEGYARECVRLAGLVDDPPVRDGLLDLAREWMSAAMDADAETCIRQRRQAA